MLAALVSSWGILCVGHINEDPGRQSGCPAFSQKAAESQRGSSTVTSPEDWPAADTFVFTELPLVHSLSFCNLRFWFCLQLCAPIVPVPVAASALGWFAANQLPHPFFFFFVEGYKCKECFWFFFFHFLRHRRGLSPRHSRCTPSCYRHNSMNSVQRRCSVSHLAKRNIPALFPAFELLSLP